MFGWRCASSDDRFHSRFPESFSTEHYDISFDTQVIAPAEAGSLLEDLYTKLTAHFGAKPAGRLSVGIYESSAAFKSAAKADFRGRFFFQENQGGVTNPTTGNVFVLAERGPTSTREILLHEATHQFHLALIRNVPVHSTTTAVPLSQTYVEGLAYHFQSIRWDGDAPKIGESQDLIQLNNCSYDAQERFDRVWKGDIRKLACDPFSGGTAHAGRAG